MFVRGFVEDHRKLVGDSDNLKIPPPVAVSRSIPFVPSAPVRSRPFSPPFMMILSIILRLTPAQFLPFLKSRVRASPHLWTRLTPHDTYVAISRVSYVFLGFDLP